MGRGPVQKKRPLFCRAPVQWPSARTRVSRVGAGKTSGLLPARAEPLIFPGLDPRIRCGGRLGGKSHGPCFCPRCRFMVPRGAFPTGGHAGPPLRKVRASQRFVGADLCVGPCPAREGQRQRKEKLHVSLISPGQGFPKGSAFPSLTAAREGQPSPAGGRRSALARTDPPKHFFFSTGRGAFSF